MQSFLQSISDSLGYTVSDAIPWLLGSLALLVGALMLLRVRRNWLGKKVHRAIRKLGAEVQSRVMVPDGIDGFIYLDYLLLTPTGFIVIDVKNYGGMLFGAESIDEWTQVVANRSYKFENPLYQNQARVAAVKILAPGIPVRGLVVFASEGQFPRGRPANVCTLDDLSSTVTPTNRNDPVPAKVLEAWRHIKSVLAADGGKA